MATSPPPGRPGRQAASKLHLRLETVGRRTYRVASLRPGCGATFSTNYFHDTWHVLSDPAGAGLFARLLWGLSFQKQAGTLVFLHGPHLRPTPFDADPSDPVALVPTALTAVVADDLAALRARLRRPSREGTRINWPTFGLDRALDEDERVDYRERLANAWQRHRDEARLEVRRAGGCVVFAGPAGALREAALSAHALATGMTYGGQGYAYFGSWRGHNPPGELQVFDRYRAMLSEAAEARRRAFAAGDLPSEHQAMLWTIGSLRDNVSAERRAARPTVKAGPPNA